MSKVKSPWSSQRTQCFLRKFISALEAMPEKELIYGRMRNDYGQVCSLGLMLKTHHVRYPTFVGTNYLAKTFRTAPFVIDALICTNDYGYGADRTVTSETNAQRWKRMHKWAMERLI